MNEPIEPRPQPGDLVTVGNLPGRFTVVDFDGRTFVLESEHGTRCRAGVRVVRRTEGAQR